jgi:1-acyl-sn-glycerol-3-phosphate acyltransferase
VTLTERVLNAGLRAAFRIACRIDTSELRRVPAHGPGFILTNHTSNVEGPAIYVFIQPRPATALAKRELWSNPITRFVMETWRTIPIERGRVDKKALAAAFRALDHGQFLGVAPEGTRSRNGVLGEGHPGIAILAASRRVPIYPVGHTGFNEMMRNLLHLRRTRIKFRVGRPFEIVLPKPVQERRPTPSQLRAVTTEIMYQLATLLPEDRRGRYRDLSGATTEFLSFTDDSSAGHTQGTR